MNEELSKAFERDMKALQTLNSGDCSKGVSAAEVLKAHYLIADHFMELGDGLGGIGPKSVELLHSAVDRQFVEFAGVKKWGNVYDICATLLFGLIKNHPFHDANKRTAFLSTMYLLNKNGLWPAVNEREFEDFTVEIAANGLSQYARYKDIVKTKKEDPEVKFISWFLRNKTRKVDKTDYSITFRELKRILNSFGYDLRNPKGNYIDVVQDESRFEILKFKRVAFERKICHIGFPRWTAEVAKGTLKQVREATRLDFDNGIDSAAFFKGIDPMQSLIATYNEPLLRLADR